MTVTARELLEKAIDALTHSDAAALMALADAVAEVELPGSAVEFREYRNARRTLEQLLVLTRRNVALLRGACGLNAYGMRRS